MIRHPPFRSRAPPHCRHHVLVVSRYFDKRNIARAATRLTKRLEALGFQVQLTTA